VSRNGTTTEEPSESRKGRGRLVGLVATGIVAVGLLALAIAQPWSDDADSAKGTDATSTTNVATTVPFEDTPAADVPLGTVSTIAPDGMCAAVVERLQRYSDAAEASSVDELQPLFDKLSEFEGEIFTFAQGAEWGDTMVEQLTIVRREWVDAGSALSREDDDAAASSRKSANERLAKLVADPPCP